MSDGNYVWPRCSWSQFPITIQTSQQAFCYLCFERLNTTNRRARLATAMRCQATDAYKSQKSNSDLALKYSICHWTSSTLASTAKQLMSNSYRKSPSLLAVSCTGNFAVSLHCMLCILCFSLCLSLINCWSCCPVLCIFSSLGCKYITIKLSIRGINLSWCGQECRKRLKSVWCGWELSAAYVRIIYQTMPYTNNHHWKVLTNHNCTWAIKMTATRCNYVIQKYNEWL